ncbi:DNA-3-methyladenine glycosylase I [Cucumibacter marinus]|uniref:DNA-3-methyladenine glycosylase I n=1 Tax=Cucumibacter marinus TaxID=1121252 RepID=UPI0004121F44|nr:DNA-3-methyladenine glycosylase I [Cucumibacter marinus]
MADGGEQVRCAWAGDDALYQHYHDTEWGWPVDSDRTLFEKICLEGFQSGLSWLTILRKRENFRAAFANFEPAKVALFDEGDVERLLGDAGIIRHRGKIEATINNARRALEMQAEFGSIAAYVWQYEPGREERPDDLSWEHLKTVATVPSSHRLSKDLKKRGWKFVGPTTCYAFMQAMGMVNDHTEDCFCRGEVETARAGFRRPGA